MERLGDVFSAAALVGQSAQAEAVIAAATTAEKEAEGLPRQRTLETMALRRNRFANAGKTLYRVYEKPGHFKLVEAGSAHEAFSKSGLQQAHKIQRELFFTQIALTKESMEPSDEMVELDAPLPEDRIKVIFDSAALDAELQQRKQVFEGLQISALKREQAVLPAPEAAASPSQASPEEVPSPAPPEQPPLPPQESPPIQEPPQPQTPPEQEPPYQEPPQPQTPPQEVPTTQQDAQDNPEKLAAAQPEEVSDRPLTADEVNALLGMGDDAGALE